MRNQLQSYKYEYGIISNNIIIYHYHYYVII